MVAVPAQAPWAAASENPAKSKKRLFLKEPMIQSRSHSGFNRFLPRPKTFLCEMK
jgi:hypothetical protein